jgi:tight adherence protein C
LFALAFTKGMAKQVSMAQRLRRADGEHIGGEGVSLRDSEELEKSVFVRVLMPLAGKWSKYLSKLTPATMVEKVEQAIGEAGMIGKVTGTQAVTLGILLMPLLPFITYVLLAPAHILSPKALMGFCGFMAFLGFNLPSGIIQGRAKKRKREIQLALPFTFDLICIGVQSGMSFDGAMQIVSERTKGALSEELQRTLREINLGISRSDALSNLARRTGIEDLKIFITAVNYITKLGGNLTQAIAVQTEALRVKRRQKAEKLANQAPVKMMIPLVLFILPCVFIAILGPAVIQIATGGLGM